MLKSEAFEGCNEEDWSVWNAQFKVLLRLSMPLIVDVRTHCDEQTLKFSVVEYFEVDDPMNLIKREMEQMLGCGTV